MYLLSLTVSVKNTYLNYRYYTKKSKTILVNDLLAKSGFYEMDKCAFSKKTKTNIKIKKGNSCDPEYADIICDFVNSKIKNEITIKELYKLIIELMGNTVQHAYASIIFNKNWYMYVEEHKCYYEFIFLDTGIGIPTTISKKMLEKFKKDSDLIASALRGEQRSSTNKKHRGTGLPIVLNFSSLDLTSNFMILSNKGHCVLENKNILKNCTNKKHNFSGTLYKWRLQKT